MVEKKETTTAAKMAGHLADPLVERMADQMVCSSVGQTVEKRAGPSVGR